MATRYWHWLVYQKKNEPVPEYYEVKGTVEIDSDEIQFNPYYDYYDYEDDGLIINVEQNENA